MCPDVPNFIIILFCLTADNLLVGESAATQLVIKSDHRQSQPGNDVAKAMMLVRHQ
jgi:hypothetical protein